MAPSTRFLTVPIGIELLNSGASPLYDVRVAAYIGFTDRDDTKPVQRLSPPRASLVVDVYASATIPSSLPIMIHCKYGPWKESERASRIVQANKVMHYIGLIIYRDVFGRMWEQDLYYLILAGKSASEFPAINFVLSSEPRKRDCDSA